MACELLSKIFSQALSVSMLLSGCTRRPCITYLGTQLILSHGSTSPTGEARRKYRHHALSQYSYAYGQPYIWICLIEPTPSRHGMPKDNSGERLAGSSWLYWSRRWLYIPRGSNAEKPKDWRTWTSIPRAIKKNGAWSMLSTLSWVVLSSI